MKKYLIVLLTLLLFPVTGQAWWNDDWSFRKNINLDTTPAGASISENMNNTYVLVKLHTGNFGYFLDMKQDGSDIRFMSGDDKTSLKFHIEKFDPINEMALIWVNVPAITSNSNTDKIYMYYGNPNAVSGQDKQGTYDVNQVLVYNFSSESGAPSDNTAYGNSPSLFEADNTTSSVLGNGVAFSDNQHIKVQGKPSLALNPDSGWTFSSWLKLGEEQTSGTVFHMGGVNNAISLNVAGTDVSGKFLANGVQVQTPQAPLSPNAWHHVSLVAAKGVMTLYLNGVAAGSVPATLSAVTGELTIGGNGFTGEMDEVAISNKERSAAWISTLLHTQGNDARLLVLGEDEQAQGSGESGSYMTILLNNVTIDGWIVIVLLTIMALISWVVMFSKGMVINRVRKDNRSFVKAFKDLGVQDPVKLDHEDTQEEKEYADSPLAQAMFGQHDQYQSSSIYRIYHVGVQDLQKRFAPSVGAAGVKSLSPQAIDTIRAGLDAALVRENQKLNSQMVLLSIAISGGPFLGLLGTVVGVMITFAAIAASGDVNVNAIAPGIAAALVATVAGLALAIPALFAYNYLGTRIKEISADMHVFVDEFITRIAEHYAEK